MGGVLCACCGWTYAALDVETTGLLPGVDAVIEVAVVLLDEHGEPTADWSSLVSPWREVDATDTHGLTAQHLAGAPVLCQIAGRLDELLAGRVLVGQNIGFDLAMLAAEWRRLDQRRAWPSADTQEAAAVLGRRGGKLDALLGEMGVERAGSAHRAASDAEATAQVWWRLLNEARARRVHLPLREPQGTVGGDQGHSPAPPDPGLPGAEAYRDDHAYYAGGPMTAPGRGRTAGAAATSRSAARTDRTAERRWPGDRPANLRESTHASRWP